METLNGFGTMFYGWKHRAAWFAFLTATLFSFHAASASETKMRCDNGPITQTFGGTAWLVYGCADDKSVSIVSAPTNKAVHFRFTFTADDSGYALHGEGQGDKHLTDAAYHELNSMSESDIEALVAATRKPVGSGAGTQLVDTQPTADGSALLVAKPAERYTPEAKAYVVLLDPKASLSDRQNAFVVVEAAAQAGGAEAQYVTGSLYRIGKALPAAPVEKDLAKARLYLSNAAANGEILAMAKMAELEVAEKHPMEAMTWAQIYGHYALLQPAEWRPSNGYVAELVERASKGITKAQLQDVVDNLNAFIVAHDNTVRSGTAKATTRPPDMAPDFKREKSMGFPSRESVPNAGFADYLLVFNPDGTLRSLLLLDATPDVRLGQILRSSLDGYHVKPDPSSQTSSPRMAFVPAVFDDGRFLLKSKNPSS